MRALATLASTAATAMQINAMMVIRPRNARAGCSTTACGNSTHTAQGVRLIVATAPTTGPLVPEYSPTPGRVRSTAGVGTTVEKSVHGLPTRFPIMTRAPSPTRRLMTFEAGAEAMGGRTTTYPSRFIFGGGEGQCGGSACT